MNLLIKTCEPNWAVFGSAMPRKLETADLAVFNALYPNPESCKLVKNLITFATDD